MAELRSFIFLDQLQPQTMCYLGTWIRGRLPRTNMAAQIIEIAPGLDIEPLTDVALKSTEVQAGILIVERQFGYLEIHSRSTAAVQAASAAVLGALGATPERRHPAADPGLEADHRIDHQHAFLINRNKIGSMALPGESLFVLEMQPASYAILATNEAEKAARIKVVDYRMIGATGRVYLAGMEADVRTRRMPRCGAGRSGMSAGDEGLLRNVTREVLAELLPGLLEEALAAPPQNGNGNGHHPRRPRPPRVMRQCRRCRRRRWRRCTGPAPGGPRPASRPPSRSRSGRPTGPGGYRRRRAGRPPQRRRPGRLRAQRWPAGSRTLATGWRSCPAGCGSPWAATRPQPPTPPRGRCVRVEKGAVTERTVREAAGPAPGWCWRRERC